MAIAQSSGIVDLGDDGAGTNEVAATPTTNLRLMGFCIKETGSPAAEAEVTIRHGNDTGDAAVAPCRLLAKGFLFVWLPDEGLECPDGVFVHRVAGNSHVTIFTRIAQPVTLYVKITNDLTALLKKFFSR